MVLRDSRSCGSLQQQGTCELWAEPIPRPYARAEESARALYGHFGMASSIYMQPVWNPQLTARRDRSTPSAPARRDRTSLNMTELEFFVMREVFMLFPLPGTQIPGLSCARHPAGSLCPP